MKLLHKRLPSTHESVVAQAAPLTEEITGEQAYAEVFEAVNDNDPIAALESLDQLSTDDIIWRLTSENEILHRFAEDLPERVKNDIQTAIVEDAITLAVHRLPPEALVGMGLGPESFDDAGISQPPSIRDALLLAMSWDSTDRDPIVGELTARTLEALPDSFADEPRAAFQLALEENISFFDAQQQVNNKVDNRVDADWGKAYERVRERRVRGEI